MKRCSQCGRTYPDDSLAFCLDDGSLLSAPYDPNATLRMSPPTNPKTTEVLPSRSMSERARPGNKSLVLYLAIGLGALIVGGVIVGLMKSGGEKPSELSANSNPAANSNAAAPATQTTISNAPRSAPTLAPLDISGNWRDQFGFVSHVTQTGDQFQITAIGRGCRGRFVTSGSGTIRGNTLELEYTSNYSKGHCGGTISPDGSQMTSDCLDTACGRFLTSSRRQ